MSNVLDIDAKDEGERREAILQASREHGENSFNGRTEYSVPESLVEDVADAIADRLSRNLGDTIYIGRVKHLAPERDFGCSEGHVGAALHDLVADPRYGVEVEISTDAKCHTSWTARRAGDST